MGSALLHLQSRNFSKSSKWLWIHNYKGYLNLEDLKNLEVTTTQVLFNPIGPNVHFERLRPGGGSFLPNPFYHKTQRVSLFVNQEVLVQR